VAGCAVAVVSLSACTSTQSTDGLDTLTVFAAASLKVPFTEIAREFESRHPGTDVVLVTAGSSTLARQLVDGASVDVFASASPTLIQRVAAADLLLSEPDEFASNIAVPVRSPSSSLRSLDQFSDERYRIVLCARTVPCGEAADELLNRAGVSTPRPSRESDVLAVAGKVASGEADAGIVYASDLRQSDGRLVPVPGTNEVPVTSRYEIAILKSARNHPRANDWIALVTSSVGQEILRDAGFGLGQSDDLADG